VALLAVGSIVPRKGYDILIAALAGLLDLPWHLTIAGDDRDPATAARLRADIEHHKLGSRISLLGAVSGSRLAELYALSELFVLPSRYEGFGLPVLEAMASGTPVVTTTGGALPEVAGEAAVLVEPGEPAALAGGIERALADRERLVRAGLERARFFSWTETARRTLQVYRELL
jgi:glycosyltransferase involved in cell wall biosynthesis